MNFLNKFIYRKFKYMQMYLFIEFKLLNSLSVLQLQVFTSQGSWTFTFQTVKTYTLQQSFVALPEWLHTNVEMSDAFNITSQTPQTTGKRSSSLVNFQHLCNMTSSLKIPAFEATDTGQHWTYLTLFSGVVMEKTPMRHRL